MVVQIQVLRDSRVVIGICFYLLCEEIELMLADYVQITKLKEQLTSVPPAPFFRA